MCFIVILTGRTDMHMLLKENINITMPYDPTLTSSSLHSFRQWTVLLLSYYNATQMSKGLFTISAKNGVKQQITTITLSSS